MATSSNPKNRQRKHEEDNVVKLVTHGKVSGQFSQSSFSKLSPLVRVPLENISEGGLLAKGHVFLGFIRSGRYILSYTKYLSDDPVPESEESDSEDPWPDVGFNYTLYWWEFNLHSKLKLVQQVKLFANMYTAEEHHHDLLSLHVCEWPNDDSHIAIFGFDAQSTSTDQLMINLENDSPVGWCNWFVTIAPNPPAKPCSHCSAMPTRSGSGGRCLEHGFALHGESEVDCPFTFQPALQLKKDKVILLKKTRMLVACAIYLCPAGEQSQSCQMLYTKRAAPPSGQPSSPPSRLPQGSAEGRHPSTGSSYPFPPTLPSSSSQEADLYYVDYKCYHLPQPEEEEQDVRHCFLKATDLQGRGYKLRHRGSHDGQSLCVEEMALDINHLLLVLLQGDAVWEPRTSGFDFVLMEVCPETDKVLIGIALFWKCEGRNMQVSWDLSTGLCSVIGVSDCTREVPWSCLNPQYGRAVGPHRKSCVASVMECPVPVSSFYHVNVIDAEDDLPKTVLADTERCTWVTTG